MPGIRNYSLPIRAIFVEKAVVCYDEVTGVAIHEIFTHLNTDFNANSIRHLSQLFEQYQLPNNKQNSFGHWY